MCHTHPNVRGVLRLFLRCAADWLTVMAFVEPCMFVRMLAVFPFSVAVFLAILATDGVTGHLVLEPAIELRKGLSDVVFRSLVWRKVDERRKVVYKCISSEAHMNVGAENDLFFHNSVSFWLIKRAGRYNHGLPCLGGYATSDCRISRCDSPTESVWANNSQAHDTGMLKVVRDFRPCLP